MLTPFVDYLTEDQGNWERQNNLHIGPTGEDLPFGTSDANKPPREVGQSE